MGSAMIFEIVIVVSHRHAIVMITLSIVIQLQFAMDQMSPMLKSTGDGSLWDKVWGGRG